MPTVKDLDVPGILLGMFFIFNVFYFSLSIWESYMASEADVCQVIRKQSGDDNGVLLSKSTVRGGEGGCCTQSFVYIL